MTKDTSKYYLIIPFATLLIYSVFLLTFCIIADHCDESVWFSTLMFFSIVFIILGIDAIKKCALHHINCFIVPFSFLLCVIPIFIFIKISGLGSGGFIDVGDIFIFIIMILNLLPTFLALLIISVVKYFKKPKKNIMS